MAHQSLLPEIRSSQLILVYGIMLRCVDVDLTLVYDGKRVLRQVTPTTKVSVLRSMISKCFGINVRKRKVVVIDEDGGGEAEIEEGDASREVGWFISGRKGEVVVR
jgi:hypothetical protein